MTISSETLHIFICFIVKIGYTKGEQTFLFCTMKIGNNDYLYIFSKYFIYFSKSKNQVLRCAFTFFQTPESVYTV